jgi:MTH538 TIR-like domain (DUF1863)
MGVPRTFVGFSSTDIVQWHLMLAWKEKENIDFDFYNCQLQNEINSDDEDYIKQKCKERIKLATTYIMLIGKDTRLKTKYVKWEAEVAIEKRCRIIGVNLDGWRRMNDATCPSVLQNVGAMFVPYSARIVAHALKHAEHKTSGNWEFLDETYKELRYVLVGDRAEYRPASTILASIFNRK